MRLFDSHAHWWDDKLAGESQILLPRLFAADLAGVINVGTSPETSRLAVRQARQYPGMYTAVGIHPTDCAELPGSLSDHVDAIRRLAADPASKAVAIGEIGLDYHWEPYDKARQMAYFEAQMALAGELGLPVCIHDRDAHGDCFDTILRYPAVRGVFHSFSGSPELARELVRHGWYVSFSGTLTFTNARRVREAARGLPHDRVLIETDAPYLTPHPYRGTCNHSGYVALTCAALAAEWGISTGEAAEITFRNACALFRLPAESGNSPGSAPLPTGGSTTDAG